jgi:hypothetical protein
VSLQTQLSAAQRAAQVVVSGTWSIVTQYMALPRAGAVLSDGLFAADAGAAPINASNKMERGHDREHLASSAARNGYASNMKI